MIQIRGLYKQFGSLVVLKNLSLDIPGGGITAILGPNASGKTTLIKSILGLVTPDAGSISIDGNAILGQTDYKRHLGYMPQIARFPENLTVAEVLSMVKSLRDFDGALDEELFSSFALSREMDKKLRNLSGGTRQKVSATIAFLFNPAILVLDEPTAGLDPLASSYLKDKIIREKNRGRTVILTSHVMSEIHELADKILYLQDGSIIYNGELQEMIRRTGETGLERAIAQMMKETN